MNMIRTASPFQPEPACCCGLIHKTFVTCMALLRPSVGRVRHALDEREFAAHGAPLDLVRGASDSRRVVRRVALLLALRDPRQVTPFSCGSVVSGNSCAQLTRSTVNGCTKFLDRACGLQIVRDILVLRLDLSSELQVFPNRHGPRSRLGFTDCPRHI